MERIIDYLAAEEKQQEATKARKDGKKARIAKLLKNVVTPVPVVDYLAMGD